MRNDFGDFALAIADTFQLVDLIGGQMLLFRYDFTGETQYPFEPTVK
jgi:hypothetical protein